MRTNNKQPRRRPNPTYLSQFVDRAINRRLEHKSVNIGSSSAPSTTGTVLYLTPIAQDDSVNGRTGDVIRPNLLELRITAQNTTNLDYYRVIVFKDNMNQGSAPAVTDVLNTADYNSAYAYINVEQQKRFTILTDKTMGLNPNGNNAKVLTKKIRLLGTTHYVGTTNGVASAGKNTYFAIFINAAAGGGQNFNARLNYTDG